MVLALGVRLHVVLALEPLGAFDTVVPTEPRQILSILSLHVLLQMAGRIDVVADLVEASAEELAYRTNLHRA